MYSVIIRFSDVQDDGYTYVEGDVYPRKGYKPSEERIAELSGKDNAFGKPIIKAIKKNEKKSEK